MITRDLLIGHPAGTRSMLPGLLFFFFINYSSASTAAKSMGSPSRGVKIL
jgi:hypothetical protein